MTREEIIELANDAELCQQIWIDDICIEIDSLVAFAKLVAAKEREACANLCWKSEDDNAFVNSYNGKRIDLLCSELIRARGQA
jgi:hypothetical protein